MLNQTALRATCIGFALCLPTVIASAQTVALSKVATVLPGITTDQTATTNGFVRGAGGSTGVLTFELDDDFDAVQIGIENGIAGFGIDRIVVAPSASYGPDSAIGATPRDLDGNLIDSMLPVQFGNGGANSPPPSAAGGLFALPNGKDAAPGATTLRFATTNSPAAYGGNAPKRGWYVADGLGCITPGTTISAITATTIALSASVTGAGCGKDQQIYVSATPFGPFQFAVPPVDAATGATSISYSDWVPMASLPRVDGGFQPGAAVTGAGIVPGTTLTGVSGQYLILSQPVRTAMAARATVTLSAATVSSSQAIAGRTTIAVSGTKGLHIGQTLSGDAAIAPSTHIAAVAGKTLTIDTPLVATLPANTTLTASASAVLAAAAKRGDTTLHLPSASTRRLLHLRYFTQAGNAPTVHSPTCQPDPAVDALQCEEPLGLPPVWDIASRTGVDGVNKIPSLSGRTGQPRGIGSYPSFFIRYNGRHAGATLLLCGGFPSAAGAGPASGEASFAHLAAALAALAAPTRPVTVTDVSSAALDTTVNAQNCTNWLAALVPSIVIQQDYSNHNGATIPAYMASVQTIGQAAIAQGTQPIVYLAYAEGSNPIGALPVAGAVQNSTVVPLLTGNNADVAAQNALVVGAGVPAGTTATAVAGQWSLSLSRPVTLPAGSVLNYGYQLAALDPTGTMLAFTDNAFQNKNNNTLNGPGVPKADKLTTTQNSPYASVKSAITTPIGSMLTVSFDIPPNGGNYVKAAAEYRQETGEPWFAIQIDAASVVSTDPVHANLLCQGCTTQGLYGNDYAATLIADLFLPTLQELLHETKTAKP